jgi:threonine synthase
MSRAAMQILLIALLALTMLAPASASAQSRPACDRVLSSTIADGLRVPRAIGDFLIVRAVRESGGTAISVPDPAMIDGMLELGAAEGISASREGGAALAAIRTLAAHGAIRSNDRVVLFNTGGALKYLDVLPAY